MYLSDLVRRVCPECRQHDEPTEQEAILLQSHGIPTDRLQRGKGCGNCNHTGYRGRVAIHEVLRIDPHLREIISEGASLETIRNAASDQQMITLMEDALQKVGEGVTTLQEVMRETISY